MPYRVPVPPPQDTELDPRIAAEALRGRRRRQFVLAVVSFSLVAVAMIGTIRQAEHNERDTTARLVSSVLGCLVPDPTGDIEALALTFRAARLSSHRGVPCEVPLQELEVHIGRTRNFRLLEATKNLHESLDDDDSVLLPHVARFVAIVRSDSIAITLQPREFTPAVAADYRTLSSLPPAARIGGELRPAYVLQRLPAGSPFQFLMGTKLCTHRGAKITCRTVATDASWPRLDAGEATLTADARVVVLNDDFPKMYALREGMPRLLVSDLADQPTHDGDHYRNSGRWAFLFPGHGLTVVRHADTPRWDFATRDLNDGSVQRLALPDLGEVPHLGPRNLYDACVMPGGASALSIDENIFFRTKEGWSSPFRRAGSGVLSCDKDSATSLRLVLRVGAAVPRRATNYDVEAAMQTCAAKAGCGAVHTVQLAPTGDAEFADAVLVAGTIFQVVARDGVRIHIPSPTARSALVVDDHVDGQRFLPRSPVSHLKLIPSGDGVVLLVSIPTGVYAFSVDKSAKVTPLSFDDQG